MIHLLGNQLVIRIGFNLIVYAVDVEYEWCIYMQVDRFPYRIPD